MGTASWIIKHIFPTIQCNLAKWMWTMRALPSCLFYLARNGWRIDGQDGAVRATASLRIHCHYCSSFFASPSSFIISVIVFLQSFILYAFLVASLFTSSLSLSHCVSFSLWIFSFSSKLPETNVIIVQRTFLHLFINKILCCSFFCGEAKLRVRVAILRNLYGYLPMQIKKKCRKSISSNFSSGDV